MPLNSREALAAVFLARGVGQPHAWRVLREANPGLADHLATLGEAGWPNLVKQIESIKTKAIRAFSDLVRPEIERHSRDAKEAWETVCGAGGADNGGDGIYLREVCPTAADRLTASMVDADVREKAAWFPWTKRKARAAAWAWTDGYLVRGYQAVDSQFFSWTQDFNDDTHARITAENPKAAYRCTDEGVAAAWACRWLAKNKPESEQEDIMPRAYDVRPDTAAAILAGLRNHAEQKKTSSTLKVKEVDPNYIDPSLFDDDDDDD